MTQVGEGIVLMGIWTWEFRFFGSKHDAVWILWDFVDETSPQVLLHLRCDFRVPTTTHEVCIPSILLCKEFSLLDSFSSLQFL